ncbi:MAG: DNA polymerase III subunit delta' [Clostridiaceae bacterium]|nr:DNA polymerase III subunit delta' [Clostridiaceae bacterium]
MTLTEPVGQQSLKKRLLSALQDGAGHAYLFSGPAGSGRHTFAIAFAKALLCQQPREDGACGQCDACRHFANGIHPDFKQLELVDKEKNIKVERVRQLCADISMQPQRSERKVYLINGDYLNEQGQNALLKSLEEPPGYVVFLMISSGTEKLLPTVLSRLTMLRMQRYSSAELFSILEQSGFVRGEKMQFLVRYANGLPGRALELAGNEKFIQMRQETVDFYLDLPRKSRTELLSSGFSFFDERRDDSGLIFSVMSSLIRDQLLMTAEAENSMLVNQDLLNRLRAALPAHEAEKRLGSCFDSLKEAGRALALNASFEVMICQLLLSLRKELANA